MRTTLMAFLLGAILAGGIAYLMVPDRRAPEPAAVALPAPAAPAEEPVVPAEMPVVEPAPVAAAPVPIRVPRRRAETPARRARPVEVARDPEPLPAAPAPSVEPQPVEPYKPESPSLPAETVSVSQAAVVEPEKPAAPEPAQVTIPLGTLLPVRLGQSLSSDRETSGDAFTATLTEPLVVDGYVIAERGARMEGRVVDSDRGGRVKGVSSMSIHLTRLTTADGQKIDIQTDVFAKQATSSVRDDAAKVGAATVIGAAIGAIAGGGKGAAIGAGVGGAAGAGGVLATRGKAVELPVETKISFRLSVPVTVTERR